MNSIRVLLIGDIVGAPGREVVIKLLPGIVSDYDIDFTIANAENAAAGFGLTQSIALELLGCGINILTSGNHIWDKKILYPLSQKTSGCCGRLISRRRFRALAAQSLRMAHLRGSGY
jgi:calcineurin-like phosphoesterase